MVNSNFDIPMYLRHEIYKEALIQYKLELYKRKQNKDIINFGICYAISLARQHLGLVSVTPSPIFCVEAYPELAKYCPTKYPTGDIMFWKVSNTLIRYRVLNIMIHETTNYEKTK